MNSQFLVLFLNVAQLSVVGFLHCFCLLLVFNRLLQVIIQSECIAFYCMNLNCL